jgi:hypothetical protein
MIPPTLSPAELLRIREAAQAGHVLVPPPGQQGPWVCRAHGRLVFWSPSREPFEALMRQAQEVYDAEIAEKERNGLHV